MTLEDTFNDLFVNPNPDACHICGETEDLVPVKNPGLIGDKTWMICKKHQAEQEQELARQRAEKAAEDRRFNEMADHIAYGE